jgi:hypothetical protein
VNVRITQTSPWSLQGEVESVNQPTNASSSATLPVLAL